MLELQKCAIYVSLINPYLYLDSLKCYTAHFLPLHLINIWMQ